ncbi:hypothetical protein CEXT_252901 [Caerostris extrusa]|uniref:Uncharacterized protein n=1 Tax=Caerostris extrusa TaxID=172846 RepID=A0AAV4U6T8_CAEEX|nr:hypothetical protein CEXT_252901 [Caerostris extrusa]
MKKDVDHSGETGGWWLNNKHPLCFPNLKRSWKTDKMLYNSHGHYPRPIWGPLKRSNPSETSLNGREKQTSAKCPGTTSNITLGLF